jgi:hypothetical protein
MPLTPLVDIQRSLGTQRPALLVLGRPSCDDCVDWYAALSTWQPTRPLDMHTLDLTTPEGAAFKAANPWTEHIDFIPFNVLYVDGEAVDHWTGEGLERLEERLEALEG